MGAEQRLPVALALGVLLAIVGLGNWHAGACGHLPDGFGKRDLVVQLDELEDVALGATPEAVKEPLVAVDVKRRRLLAVKRAESLPRRAAAPQRDALLDHLHDVGVRFEVLDEAGGEERQTIYSLNSTTVTPPPPCSGGAEAKCATNLWSCRNSAMARRS